MPIAHRFPSQLLRHAAIACLAAAALAVPLRAEDAAKPTPPATEQPRRATGDLSQFLPIMRERLNALDLTADQKTKVDAIFAKATEDLKKAQEENKDADSQERMQKVREVMTGLRGKLAEVLTDEQKAKGPGLTAGGAAAGRAPGAGFDALTKNLEKLGLSDDQKAKVKTLIDDTKKAMQDLRASAQNDGNRDAVREKAQILLQDFRTHLAEILTPEQAAKLKELMPANRPAAEKPAATEKKGT